MTDYDCVIVEPHEDDALLSNSHFLLNEGLRRLVVTCSVRRHETADLCASVGASSKYLEFKDYPWADRVEDNKYTNFQEYLDFYISRWEIASGEPEGSMKDRLVPSLQATLSETTGLVLLPLGCKHPYHCVISEIGRKICVEMGREFSYYFDFPYCFRRKWEFFIKWRATGGLLKELPVDEERRMGYLKRFYKEQMGILRFEGDKWKNDRVVVFGQGL